MRFLNRISLLLALATAALAGCDDSKSNSTPDAGNDSGAGENTCPAQAPDRDELDPSCCFRSSNADKQDAPQFRLTSLNISAPAPLANPLIVSIVQGALNNESFNWLVQLDGAGGDGDVTVRTGLGIRAADGSFSFAYGQAPAPGSANRWNPAEFTGALSGESFSGESDGSFIIPIGSPANPIVELPLSGVSITKAEMSESRSCIGSINAGKFDASKGALETFITVDAAAAVKIDQSPINTYLCNFIAMITTSEDPCTEVDRGDWQILPDSLCDESGCTYGDCDGATECNAWKLTATFSAAGADISGSDNTDAGQDGG